MDAFCREQRTRRTELLISRKRNRPTPHAALCNVGIQNRMTLSKLEDSLEQNHRLKLNRGGKRKTFGSFVPCIRALERVWVCESQRDDCERVRDACACACARVGPMYSPGSAMRVTACSASLLLSGSQSRGQLEGTAVDCCLHSCPPGPLELAHFTPDHCVQLKRKHKQISLVFSLRG